MKRERKWEKLYKYGNIILYICMYRERKRENYIERKWEK